ncbi:ankyrin-1-like isoform X1 [Leguminivora glycinivorella]|uniref:ankyrin-1-like isoform X1 n=1 Tax=Leguminivora glycinivorella TaxID=1035111 RepID=UPI00200FFD41|nr:ankyrin-1-like isoform X1 [Leguminivora glycinivorella]
MDFSSLNPNTSNPLNIAARKNDFQNVHRLLKKVNPNCVDNRGWTCLHEAAANDSYQSLVLILKHPDCRPLAETHEGHTALYLACRHHSSLQTIKALLDSAEDIANYGSTESVTPLHVASTQGRVEVIQLLIDHGAMIDVQDFDGDTPLHDAALALKLKSVTALLHAGADPAIKNETGYTPFHLACFKGGFDIIKAMIPFVDDINEVTANGDTPLITAFNGNNESIIQFLLDNGADPHIKNNDGFLALDVALNHGCDEIFNLLLGVINKEEINKDFILLACKPHYYKYKILESLLNHDLGPEFFDFYEEFVVTLECIGDLQPHYQSNAPLNSYLNICEYIYNSAFEAFRQFFYLFLMNGVAVNALRRDECPPLVYIHYTGHGTCFEEVFKILIEHNCNVDYSSLCTDSEQLVLPDAFIASVTSDPATTLLMLPYSLHCEPDHLLTFTHSCSWLSRIPVQVQKQLLFFIDNNADNIKAECLSLYVPPLKHLSRLKVRSVLRSTGINTTEKFLQALEKLPIPPLLKHYLRYL